MKGRSSTGSPPERTADSCASRTSFITPLSAATSPPTRTWQYSLAIRVELNVTILIGFCGAANRSSARSRNGFIATIGTPLLDDLVQGGHHARAVRTGILPDHKDCVRFVEILQQNGALCRCRCSPAGPRWSARDTCSSNRESYLCRSAARRSGRETPIRSKRGPTYGSP